MKPYLKFLNKVMLLIATSIFIIFINFEKLVDVISPLNIYIDRGITGPYSTDNIYEMMQNHLAYRNDVEPGKPFYLLSIFCPTTNLGYTSTIQYRSRRNNQIIYTQTFDFEPNQRICGAAAFMQVLPDDTPDGVYRLERSIVFNNTYMSFYRFRLSSLEIRVKRH